MSLAIGIVGLPNVGKSTLFNAITKIGAASANYPFCTIEPNVGIVDVPDGRLYKLAELVKPQRVLPASCKFVDIAGLVQGASQGEGLGNKFLSHIREVSAVVHMVRCFEDKEILHVSNKVDPIQDIETINLELILSDLDIVEKRLARLAKQAKSGGQEAKVEQEVLSKVASVLSAGKKASTLNFEEAEHKIISSLNLLTAKNVLYVANVGEEDLADIENNMKLHKVKELANTENAQVITLCAKLEAELALLEKNEQQLFMEELGIQTTGLDQMIKASYEMLDLITYFTAGEKEVRAWTIKRNTKAPEAASVIHSDIARGFIRAEIISYKDYLTAGSDKKAKERGLMKLEGKDYLVQDGDVVHFRFAV